MSLVFPKPGWRGRSGSATPGLLLCHVTWGTNYLTTTLSLPPLPLLLSKLTTPLVPSIWFWPARDASEDHEEWAPVRWPASWKGFPMFLLLAVLHTPPSRQNGLLWRVWLPAALCSSVQMWKLQEGVYKLCFLDSDCCLNRQSSTLWSSTDRKTTSKTVIADHSTEAARLRINTASVHSQELLYTHVHTYPYTHTLGNGSSSSITRLKPISEDVSKVTRLKLSHCMLLHVLF